MVCLHIVVSQIELLVRLREGIYYFKLSDIEVLLESHNFKLIEEEKDDENYIDIDDAQPPSLILKI